MHNVGKGRHRPAFPRAYAFVLEFNVPFVVEIGESLVAVELSLIHISVQNLRLVNDGYFEDCPYMLPMLDGLLSEKDFYSAMERAADLQQAGVEAEPQLKEFYEWKAAQALTDFFLHFLSNDIKAIYEYRKRGD